MKRWETLTPEEKKLFIRQADVYAAYLMYTDYEIGRVIQAVQDMGKLDNTLIIYISGDNGAGAEGTPNETPNELLVFNGVDVPVAEQMKLYDAWGSDKTYNHFAVGWAWAFDTPYKWTKQIPSFFGGTHQGMTISWPRPYQGCRRNPLAIPPCHRHCAHDPRSDRDSGSRDGRWSCPKAT